MDHLCPYHGQPFILNAVTTEAARWFPMQEQATAVGLGSLALTPVLTIQSEISGMLLIYGIVSMVAAAVFFAVVRERPPSAPCLPGQEKRSLVFDGFKASLRINGFILLLVIFFVGLGVFNAVTTWIEDIVRPRGFLDHRGGQHGRSDDPGRDYRRGGDPITV